MATITMEIPEDLLGQFDSMEQARRARFEDLFIAERQSGNISLGRAAELLGMSYSDFFSLLGKKGLSFINAPKDELQESYQRFETLLEQQRA
ncbi:UPF0175 family protein [candidate division KSB1 bacterium]|nr:UPF0175 family protein [candidate division KSB1 bacterium]